MTEFFQYTLNGRARYLNLHQILYVDDMGPALEITFGLPTGAGSITLFGADAERLRTALQQRAK